MDSAMAIAASGLSAVSASMDALASKIVNGQAPSANTASAPAGPGKAGAAYVPPANSLVSGTLPDSDLVSQMASLALAQESYRANLAVCKSAQKMTETAINTLA